MRWTEAGTESKRARESEREQERVRWTEAERESKRARESEREQESERARERERGNAICLRLAFLYTEQERERASERERGNAICLRLAFLYTEQERERAREREREAMRSVLDLPFYILNCGRSLGLGLVYVCMKAACQDVCRHHTPDSIRQKT